MQGGGAIGVPTPVLVLPQAPPVGDVIGGEAPLSVAPTVPFLPPKFPQIIGDGIEAPPAEGGAVACGRHFSVFSNRLSLSLS